MNDRCYYFHNEEVKLFDDAQKKCSEIFKKHGFYNGRLYEPKDLGNFTKVYELAEKFSMKPELQLWLGLNDKSKEGEFVYNSNNERPKFKAPFAGYYKSFSQNEKNNIKFSPKQPNGKTTENCLITFKLNNEDRPMWFDRPCIENDAIDEVGHRFICEFNVPHQTYCIYIRKVNS